MSSRRRDESGPNCDADRLRAELTALKSQHAVAETAGTLAGEEVDQGATLTFDQLSTTEQSAASLGVHPEAWKPIKCVPAALPRSEWPAVYRHVLCSYPGS